MACSPSEEKSAPDPDLTVSLSPREIAAKIDLVLQRVPPKPNHAALLEEILAAFRQWATLQGTRRLNRSMANTPNKTRKKKPAKPEPTSPERSAQMARVRSKDTKPELIVRRALWRAGFRYRLHSSRLPGKPDICLPSWKTVVFVHGCFWHRHASPECKLARLPKTRLDFWLPKLEGNAARDRLNQAALRKKGWRVIVIWECETTSKNRVNNLIDEIKAGRN